MPTKFSSKPSKLDLTISIVSFNTRVLLRRCLESIYQHTRGISFEVIVIDNHSRDGSVAMVKKHFPQVRLIKNKDNQFYTGANNQALTLARGGCFLILNSDIFLKDNAFKKMLGYLKKHPRVGAVEPLQKYEDGRIVPTGSRHNTPFLDLVELTLFRKICRPQKQLDAFRMKNKDRTQTFSAPVICDACLILRTDLFKQLGGYDENFKLYYTENDLCRRLQAKKLKTVHLGNVAVWHRVSASTDKAGWQTISAIYARDALSYYKKHDSKLNACLLYFAIQLNNGLIRLKKNLWLVLILALALLLRFYRLPSLMTFIGDQGHDYLAARDLLLTGRWPLVGIPSSVPWLFQGPFFIWLIALAFKLTNFNPVAPAVFTAVFGVLAIYLVYQLASQWFGKKSGLIAGLIMAVSPLVVINSRMPYHTSPIPLFSILFLTAVYHWAKKNLSLFWPVFIWSVLLQFELTTAPLILLIILVCFWQKTKLKKKDLIAVLAAAVIPFIPKFIYDLTHGFQQTFGFIAWLGYRFFSFFGFRGQHTVNLQSLRTVTLTIFGYWQKFILYDNPLIAGLLSLLIVVPLLIRLKQKFLPLHLKILFSFILINFSAFYLHQAPSEAYFPVLFPAWVLLIAWLVSYLKKPSLAILFIVISLYNLQYLIHHNFIPYGPTLSQRLELVKLIKLKNQPFKLQNYPTVPHTSYLDNYRYLLWYLGLPEDPQADLIYTIYDAQPEEFIPLPGSITYNLDNQKLIKHD